MKGVASTAPPAELSLWRDYRPTHLPSAIAMIDEAISARGLLGLFLSETLHLSFAEVKAPEIQPPTLVFLIQASITK